MMYALRALLIIALIVPPIVPAFATGDHMSFRNDGTVIDERTGETVASAGGSCDWGEFRDALVQSESGGSCTIRNKKWNYAGKYQFGEKALHGIGWYEDSSYACGQCWQDFNGRFVGKANTFGVYNFQDFLNNCEAQDAAFNDWMTSLYRETSKCHNFIGQQAPRGNCTVTLSGILGAAHLGGSGGACRHLTSGGSYNPGDGHTRISDYLCKFANYETPFDDGAPAAGCNPSSTPGRGGDGGGTQVADPERPTQTNEDITVEHYQMLSDLIVRVWLAGLALMTNQMVNTMMMQAEIIGSFFDAKHQLETQRLLQQKTARAHKDYHPSEQMCTIGTFARNLHNTGRRAQFSQAVLSERGIQRELQRGDNIAIEGEISDRQSRFETFRTKFCNAKDNAGTLAAVCEKNIDPAMINRDIDFTRTIDLPLTLAIDPLVPAATDEETAVYALMDNLFQYKPIPAIPKTLTTLQGFQDAYMDLRAITAMRSVARNSMNNIIAQKSYGPESGEASNVPFLRALIKDMGLTDEEEITRILGERPSYYAQMEILTKTLYQNPEFIVNLYDKPANVTRLRASMRAIKVMQDRDIQEALMRREMLISMLAELSVRRQQSHIDTLVHSLRISP